MKIIAVLGDFYHKEYLLKNALSEAVREIEGIEVVYASRTELLDKLSEKPGLVIVASENRLDPEKNPDKQWMTESVERHITDYVKKGGNWFAWHSGLAGYEENGNYVSMLGGYFTHHPDDLVKVRYDYKDDHVLSHGKDVFAIRDEHYFIERVEKSTYFLESLSAYGASDAGWTRSYGEGKVCCYIPAHNEEGLMNVSVQRDLGAIIRWFK
ncbi:Trehalose utilisation [Alkalibacterium subtropicum]|uniref:Trehalose utilisation n=2 Tax=Alkalibacterium subtropicum TaxID=753702 RepID=A0A1I1M1N2_9LACT|nr:Trehalose utilisation [Alkalibacterium subtropicum]